MKTTCTCFYPGTGCKPAKNKVFCTFAPFAQAKNGRNRLKTHPRNTIEEFFLQSLLRISVAVIFIVLGTDFLFQRDFFRFDGFIDFGVLGALAISILLFRLKYLRASTLVLTLITLALMLFQSVYLRSYTTMSFSIILMIGFVFSIMLKGILRWTMHGITLACLIAVFSWQAFHFEYYLVPHVGDVITMGVTYFMLYIIIAYSTAYLKRRYDSIHEELISMNAELVDKANEIETQNEELLQSQQNLHELNINLERMVNERTEKIIQQNEQLIKYSYTNAHHLRGPVARVLGLIQVSKLEDSLDHSFIFQKIEEQTFEIDAVVRKINDELEKGKDPVAPPAG